MSTKVRSVRKAPASVSAISMEHVTDVVREEIVMTPLKAKLGQIIRVERTLSSGLKDDRKVHYFAEGPYKGIIVNKATNVRPYKTEPETKRRFVAYFHDQGRSSKELREIRFWFKRDTDSGEMEDYSTQFFRELISPKHFPKDPLLFVKRVLTLVQKYTMLKFIELEMRPFENQDDPSDFRGEPFSTDSHPRLLRKAKSTVDHHPVRQVASTDDLHAGQGRRKVRRLTVGGVERGRGGDDDLPTVFVYDPTDADKPGSSKKKSNGSASAAAATAALMRSEALENLTDDSVFSAVNGDKTTHIHGVNRKSRRSTDAESTPSPLARESIVHLTRSPGRPSKSGHDATDGHVTPATPEKRRSSRRVKSSTDLTSSGAVLSPTRDIYIDSDVFDSGAGQPKSNGRHSSSSSRRKSRHGSTMSFRDSKVVALLEDAFPTMLSVDDLARMSRLSRGEVEKELGKLSSVGVASEVDSGMWVRAKAIRRLSATSKQNNRHSSRDTDLQKNEFRMVASTPSLAPEDQPTIAIVTSLYCEKMAVDAMMDIKTTYVRYKTQAEGGVIYTVGVIDRHRVVSTKLSKVGHGSDTRLSAERTIPHLLETFGQIEHVLLVGVGGGVANYDDDSEHVRLGDVVVSKAFDRSNHFLYFHVSGADEDQSTSITLETRPWHSADSELRNVVGRFQKSPKKLWKQMDSFLAESTRELESAGDVSFLRPPQETDQLYRAAAGAGAKGKTPVPHPRVVQGTARDQRPGHPLVHFGAVASGKVLTRDDGVRSQFCHQQKVKAIDGGFQRVLDSLENQAGLSFAIIRGISDYGDGARNKEWQPYAALAAAAVMKCLVMRLSLPGDEDGLV